MLASGNRWARDGRKPLKVELILICSKLFRKNVLKIKFFPFFLSIVEIVARNDRHIIKGLYLCFLILAN